MKTILLCIDTDVERAKAQVESITALPLKTDELEIVVYHVFRGSDEPDVKRLKSVMEATKRLESEGFTVKTRQSSGDTARNILQMAEELDVDSISIAGRKRSPTGKALFGSITQDVVLESDRPVLLCTDQ
jgi:nucleotide-binding universal stress UspA family protein